MDEKEYKEIPSLYEIEDHMFYRFSVQIPYGGTQMEEMLKTIIGANEDVKQMVRDQLEGLRFDFCIEKTTGVIILDGVRTCFQANKARRQVGVKTPTGDDLEITGGYKN